MVLHVDVLPPAQHVARQPRRVDRSAKQSAETSMQNRRDLGARSGVGCMGWLVDNRLDRFGLAGSGLPEIWDKSILHLGHIGGIARQLRP
jgi:hypothetical protein